MNWIRTKDRLPVPGKDSDWILAWDGADGWIACLKWCVGEGRLGWFEHFGVTHWCEAMPPDDVTEASTEGEK